MKVRDDSGKQIRFAVTDELPDRVASNVQRHIRRQRRHINGPLVALVLVTCLIGTFGAIYGMGRGFGMFQGAWRFLEDALPLLVLGAALVLGFWLTTDPDKSRARVVAKRLAAENVCGACGYDMLDLPSDDDGLVTCPECTAKWRKPEVPT